ncbi:hypothetical protein KXW93_007215, partial [Aspergillus fumigatus]
RLCSEIFSGVLAPEALEGETHVDSELAEELEQHKGRIWDVQVLICVETDDPAIKEIYDFALHSLQDIFDEVYRLRAAGQHGFIGWLEAKDLFALAVLAYWAILLKYMQTSWMMMGWDEHVLAGVLAFLPEEHRHNAFTTFPKPYQFNPKKNGRKPAEQIWIANGATATFAVEYGPGVIVHPQGSPTAK